MATSKLPEICISLKDNQIKCEDIPDGTHAVEVLKRIDTFKNNDQQCDVCLIAGNDGKRISAHRLILAGSSEYFSAMFTGSLRESSENEVTLKDISGEVLEILVRYCYTGCLELRGETVERVLTNADMMQLHSAVATCCSFLERNLHPHNCIEFSLFAQQRNLVTLLKSSQKFICKHFMEISTTTEFLQLEAPQLSEIIASDDLNVDSEEFVFDAVQKWIEYDEETRRDLTVCMLAHVRLPLLSPAFIADNVEPICRSIESKMLIIEALKWHLEPEQNFLFLNKNTCPRNQNLRLMAIYHKESTFKIADFNKSTSTWSEWFSLSISGQQFGIAVMDGKIVFAGGYLPNEVYPNNYAQSKNVSCFDWSTKKLKPLEPLTSTRYGHVLISHNGVLYVIGGKNDSGQQVGTVEKLYPESRSWVSCESMQTPRSDAGVGVINGQLYIVGGKDFQSRRLDSVECFRTDTGKWHSIALLNRPRSNPGVVAVNGLLYAFGGCETRNSFEHYDPQTDKWTLFHEDNLCAHRSNCTAIGNFIYVSCGNNTVKEYDTVRNTWKPLPQYKDITLNGSILLLTIPYPNANKMLIKAVLNQLN